VLLSPSPESFFRLRHERADSIQQNAARIAAQVMNPAYERDMKVCASDAQQRVLAARAREDEFGKMEDEFLARLRQAEVADSLTPPLLSRSRTNSPYCQRSGTPPSTRRLST